MTWKVLDCKIRNELTLVWTIQHDAEGGVLDRYSSFWICDPRFFKSSVADWSIRQFCHNNFTSFLVNLLLDPIGMLIPWLKKSWITNPKLLNWVLSIQNSAYRFILDYLKPRLFKWWNYLSVPSLSFLLT